MPSAGAIGGASASSQTRPGLRCPAHPSVGPPVLGQRCINGNSSTRAPAHVGDSCCAHSRIGAGGHHVEQKRRVHRGPCGRGRAIRSVAQGNGREGPKHRRRCAPRAVATHRTRAARAHASVGNCPALRVATPRALPAAIDQTGNALRSPAPRRPSSTAWHSPSTIAPATLSPRRVMPAAPAADSSECAA